MFLLFVFCFCCCLSNAQQSFALLNCNGTCNVTNPSWDKCACAAVNALNAQFYYSKTDAWLNSLWQTGNGVETMYNYMNYSLPNANQLPARLTNIWSNFSVIVMANDDYYDDKLWWCLAALRAYEQTRNNFFLQYAKVVFQDVQTNSWDTTKCGGGYYWSTDYNYKNAITNSLAIAAASKLALLMPSPNSYGQIADVALRWFLQSGMINSQWLINDGLVIPSNGSSSCYSNKGLTWTYNQGVILLGLELAAKRQANSSYLALIEQLFDGVLNGLCDDNGVLHEPMEQLTYNLGDQLIFKGVYVRYLNYVRSSMRPQVQKQMQTFLEIQSESVLKFGENVGSSLYGPFWAGPVTKNFDQPTAASQLAALDALIATASI